MLDRYEPHFENITGDEACYLADAVARRHPEFVPQEGGPYEQGTDLFHHLSAYGLDQADVVLSLAPDPAVRAVSILEHLIGQPITRTAPVVETRKSRRPVATRAPRTDPRTILSVAPNPKRPGTASHERYEHYTTGITVTEAISRGLTSGDIKHDVAKGFITLGDPS